MHCKECEEGYLPQVNINGIVYHRGYNHKTCEPLILCTFVEDGPEIDIIRFFTHHPYGKSTGIHECLHVKTKGGVCDFER